MTHWKKFPDPGLKSITLAERLKQITRRLTDSWVQQMKTTCHDGKHLCRGKARFCCKREYQSTQFPLAGPCNDTHTSSQSLRYERGRREVSDHTYWKETVSWWNSCWDLPGLLSEASSASLVSLISLLDWSEWVGEGTEYIGGALFSKVSFSFLWIIAGFPIRADSKWFTRRPPVSRDAEEWLHSADDHSTGLQEGKPLEPKWPPREIGKCHYNG